METIKFNNILFYKIKNFNDYYISKCGKVLSTKRNNLGKILKLYFNKNNYPQVSLGIQTISLHRLLAKQFILNPNNLLVVEHIDDNPSNYSLDNLKWSTQSANIKKAYNIKRKKAYWKNKKHCNCRRIIQLDLNNNLIKIWDSLMDIQNNLGYFQSNITMCCQGKRKTSKGFKWQYK